MNNDLISRSAAIEAIEKREPFLVGDKRVGVDSFKTFLKNRPAVDAEPVRHARWIQSKSVPSYHSCSNCHRTQKMEEAYGFYILPYYCEWCGANMDGEDDGRND